MILIKNREQIDGIRESCQLAKRTLLYLEQFLTEGVSTAFLDQKANEFIIENNAISACLNYKGFPKSICTSINEVVCHGIPSEKDILKNGDIINIDITTILNGYYGDTSKTYKIGNCSDIAKKLVKITEECLHIGIKQVYPGNRFGNIGYKINQYATENGFSVVYTFVGHGVGLDFHEEPLIPHVAPKNSGSIMKPGMIFTIEPMISEGVPEVLICEQDKWTARTLDKKLSAQFEHTILVTDSKHEILTI